MEKMSEDPKSVFQVIRQLGEGMEPEGFELNIFRFVLAPLFKNPLSKKKQLQQLFKDDMDPRFGEEQALAHLWFGVTAIGTVDPKPLDTRFKSDTELVINDGEVLYRRLLVEVAQALAADGKGKEFIEYVISTKELKDHHTTSKFMPPEEKQQNTSVFIPCILSLFREADSQCIIEPFDLKALVKWLDNCHYIKISRIVTRFHHDEVFRKHFTAKKEIPRGSSECSEESSCSPMVASSGNIALQKRHESPKRESSDSLSDESDSASTRRGRFQRGQQESGGSKDEVGEE